MEDTSSVWLENKCLEFHKNYTFVVDELTLFFGLIPEKAQIHFDYFSKKSPYNHLARSVDYLDYILNLHKTYDLIAKISADDREKLNFLDALGFKDYLIPTKITRKINKDLDVLPILPKNLQYRELNLESEVDLWHRLVMESYRDAPKFRYISMEDWKNLYLDEENKLKVYVPDKGAVVLEENGIPVGLFIASYQDENTKWGTGSTMGVIQKYRGNGYAELLLKWYINYEMRRGSVGSFLFTDTENVPATNLYLKLGYKLEGPETIIKKYK